jgi:Dirigent-like protein
MASPSELYGDKKELYFHLYFHEIFEGANQTSVRVIDPKSDFPNFGETWIMDVPLWDSLKAEKIIARVQGVSVQSDQKTIGWQLSFNIVFETPE